MGSNSSEMNLDNNDEADSNELRNLIAQQTVVQMQEHSFKNLKEEFAFWDKNPNISTQPNTLKKSFSYRSECYSYFSY